MPSKLLLAPTKQAFSLVELSIVLVILGLLVGGVLAGQSLIRAAELRAVSTEHSRWITANQTFRDKYFSWPGDFRDATRFWGRAAAVTDCVTNSTAAVTSVSAGSCDGNGDGQINGSAPNLYAESFLYWQHLARAGLIEGSYTGQAGPAGIPHTIVGVNGPRSKLSNAGWGTSRWNSPGDSFTYVFDFENYLAFGAQHNNSLPFNAALMPEEAWNIDSKMDDSKPASGRIMTRSNTAWGTATSCTTSASQTDYAGEYRLNNTSISCALLFPRIF